MYRSPAAISSPFFRKAILVLAIMLMAIALPVFGQVKSARARVLQQPNDIVTTRKANFQPGDILGTPLVSITVNNGAGASFLLLKLKVDFGGAWDADYIEVSLVKKLESSTSFTFTNTDMLSYISNIRSNDFKMSSTLLEHTGVTSFDTITNLKNMPEGTYSIILTVSEITLSNPNDINSSYTIVKEWIKETDANAKVDFNVVTIGNINIIAYPTLTNLIFTFQVPEIPVYDDAKVKSTSSTKIDITGLGVAYAATKNHSKSTRGSSAIKGYPSDTVDGYVTYDLKSVPFRAGEKYSVDITYTDWNGSTITTKTTTISTFPTPNLKVGVTTEDPYRPIFSWSFPLGEKSDYSTWVKEYRIYLNNKYMGYTTNTSYQLTDALTPSTAYTWYIMPINKDGTNFYASTSGLVQNLTTKAHTDLTVKIDAPKNNSVLFLGQNYDFSGSATYSDNATEGSSTWRIGTENKNGMSLSYSPTRRYQANSLAAYLTVIDSLSLSKTSSTINLTVLDPAIAVQGGTSRTVNKATQTTFALDSQNTRDLASYEWFVDGNSIGAGSQKNYTFPESGTHEAYVVGTTVADLNGTTKTVQSQKVVITVVGNAPVVAITQPKNTGDLVLGTSLKIIASITNDNSLSSVSWAISGPDTSQNGAAGKELTFTPRSIGEYTLTVTALDIYQKQTQASMRILVINPAITVTSPAQNEVLALNSTLTPTISAPNADRSSWFIGSTEITASSYGLSQLGTGTYQLYAVAFWNAIDGNGNPIEHREESQKVSFTVKDLVPPAVAVNFPKDSMVLKTGETYSLSGDMTSASAISETWWEVDNTRLSSNTYTPATSLTKKALTISYVAKNSDGVKGSKSVSVRLVNPAAYLQTPASTEYQVGAVVPIDGSAVDANFYWIVDGSETANWNKTFAQTGTHTVQAGWRVTAVDGSGSAKEFTGQSNPVSLTVYSAQPPVITSFTPSNLLQRETKANTLSFRISASGENTLVDTVWRVFNNGSQINTATGDDFSPSFANPGQYTVQAIVADNRGNSVSKEWTVKIIDPIITITNPQPGQSIAKGAVPAPVVSTLDILSYTLYLDGQAVEQNFNWNTLSVGDHQLYAIGQYLTTRQTPLQQFGPTDTIAFSVVDRTPPSFTIDGIKDGDRIIAGQPYNFLIGRGGNETIAWFMNGTPISGAGERYSFTAPSGSQEIDYIVRATLNGITAEKAFKVKVIEPYISIILPDSLARNGLFPAQTALSLQSERRNVDRIAWTVDSQAYTNQTVSFEPGTHTIAVRAFATGVRLPTASYGEYEAMGAGVHSREINVAGRPAITWITTASALYAGESLPVSVTTAGDASGSLISSLTYSVDGSAYKQERAPVTKSATISGLTAGTHAITVTLVDLFGNTSTMEKSVAVYKPLVLSIIQPANDARVSPDTNILASMTANSGQYSNLSWSVDGTPVSNGAFTTGSLGRLAPGKHSVSVSASDPLGKLITASVNLEVQSDFQLNLLSPAPGTEIIIGTTVTGMVSVDRVAGSQINLADAAQNISWYLNGGDTGNKGLTYTYTGAVAGSQILQARYEKGDMVRTSSERTITVRDIVAPVIKSPLNGANIVYSPGATIALSASGEPGATFSWTIDDNTIAVGSDAQFSPNGLTGQKELKLITSAFGRSAERQATITLSVNTPPILTLSAVALQFTGDALAWTASSMDIEDQNTTLPIEIFFDGVKQNSATPKTLSVGDIGQHTLSATVTDSMGVASTKQLGIVVEPKLVAVEIQSPIEGKAYYTGYDIPLMASLAVPAGTISRTGTFSWIVQYLDDTTVQPASFDGNSAALRPQAIGEVAISAKYTDSSGMERGAGQKTITVQPKPLELSINWPHGSVVNAGTPLRPTLIGLPENAALGSVIWSLNGQALNDISTLVAPDPSGEYSLTAIYSQNGSSDRAEVKFSVNGRPTVTLNNLASGAQYVFGTQIVLSAKVEDDQPYSGTIQWKKSDGTPIGEGNPFVLKDAAVGDWQISGTAVDKYGAEASSSFQFQVYAPVSNIVATVNNGQPAYLVAPDSLPLSAKAAFTGGIAPVVSWTLRQGEKSTSKAEREALFPYSDLSSLTEGPVLVTLIVTDPGLADETARELFQQDYPVELTRNAIAEIVSPVQGDVYRVGEAIPLRVAVTGFTTPQFLMQIEGLATASEWVAMEGNRLYGSEVPAALLSKEGVYELTIAVNGDGATRTLVYTLNVYASRSGIFVDNAPTEIDLEKGPAPVTAVLAGLTGVEEIAWRSDVSANTIGRGETLDLAAAGLTPGERSITVEARSGSQILSTFTFLFKVRGPMVLRVTPETEPLIVQKGAPVSLEALARDRDGSILVEDAITWTSHLDGLIGRGASLALDDLATLSVGEHIFTVEAIGQNGASITALKRVKVNAPEQGAGGQTGGDNLQNDGLPPPPPAPPGFDGGNPIGGNLGGQNGGGSFGPGGSNLDPGLDGLMQNFLTN